ncbi:MAG: exosortase system-associated protein, TIGR04073 family [Nitrosomonas sp.]|uniref:exosortase system-associated protein, TIGR04073 family n=1 Tax=Nitrosomonas sp. TaxID=42353 RepID=UPI0027319F25|nr:exosortase system-associated protein, TIGR04073 family [Nitrosomonas sp.]MDP1549556.1 exosortase system-associated protein, TIGR04073 family [Nitrosomonas sp.]
MRSISRLALLISMLFLFSSQAQADEVITTDVYFSRAGMKILSGVANVATGWMELPKNISIWNQKNNNMLSDFTEGVLWGVVHTAGRTASGAVDLATFWLPTFPTPSPIFVWDDFSKESDYYGFRMGR